MNKFALGLLVAVLVVAIGYAIFFRDSGPVIESPAGGASESEDQGTVHTIEMTDAGFMPSEFTIAPGDTVRFINKSATPRWPASGVHPTHQLCPGFDSLKGLSLDETYSFTFTEVKTCPFHDHLNPALRGQIIVQ